MQKKRPIEQSHFQMGIEEKKYIRLGKDFLSSSVNSPHIVNYARNVFEDTKKDMDINSTSQSAQSRPKRNEKLNFSMALDNSSVK